MALREAFGEGAFQVIHKYFPSNRDMVKGKDGEALETASKTSQKILSDEGATLTPARISKNPNVDRLEQCSRNIFLWCKCNENRIRRGTKNRHRAFSQIYK